MIISDKRNNKAEPFTAVDSASDALQLSKTLCEQRKIMNYEKYSREKFESIKSDKQEIIKLLKQLDRDIASDLNDFLAIRMEEIVKQLNKYGHKLKRNIEIEETGETDFCEENNSRNHGFRLGSDLVISSGYFGISDSDNTDLLIK